MADDEGRIKEIPAETPDDKVIYYDFSVMDTDRDLRCVFCLFLYHGLYAFKEPGRTGGTVSAFDEAAILGGNENSPLGREKEGRCRL